VNDEQALVRAVLARPSDETPKLVLADYLDDTGRPADALRASVIREAPPVARVRTAPVGPLGRWQWLFYPDCGRPLVKAHDTASDTPAGFYVKGLANNWWARSVKNILPRRLLPSLQAYSIDRGFVWMVSASVVDLFGEIPCENCYGSGRIVTASSYLIALPHERRFRPCDLCNATGLVGGIARELFATQPIEAVANQLRGSAGMTTYDRWPESYSDMQWRWIEAPRWNAFSSLTGLSWLPSALYRCLDYPAGLDCQPGDPLPPYADYTDACAALSRAMVRLGRVAAGLEEPVLIGPGDSYSGPNFLTDPGTRGLAGSLEL
jgi:uncharacterized protein (TIGR02996 family)